MRGRIILIAAAASLITGGSLAQPMPSRSPRANYMINCQGCHLPSGQGLPGKVPAMKGYLAKFLSVPGGREFIGRVPGVANSTLGDADLAALMNWLIPEMGPSVPMTFKPYSAEEIGTLRKSRLQDVNTARAALVAQIHDDPLATLQHPGKP